MILRPDPEPWIPIVFSSGGGVFVAFAQITMNSFLHGGSDPTMMPVYSSAAVQSPSFTLESGIAH